MSPENTPKNSQKFVCEICHFKCCKNSDFARHISTAKHLKLSNASNLLDNATVKNAKAYNHKFICACGNSYSHSSSYYRHKKICDSNKANNEIPLNNTMLTELDKDQLIITLLKQNAELIKGQQYMFIKFSENNMNISNNTNSVNNSMNNNKTFNLQFFLHETCKDAMSITDFVNNMKIELDDLENTGRTGYVEGISNIVIKNLNKLEQHMRPLHCSDFKREVLYIKDNNEWTKETENKPILTKAIKTIANQNIKQISTWKDNYPDCTKSDSKKNDLYLKIVSNSMNGLTKEEGENNINKIITNVAKKVVIDK
jgi:hypothetical protein